MGLRGQCAWCQSRRRRRILRLVARLHGKRLHRSCCRMVHGRQVRHAAASVGTRSRRRRLLRWQDGILLARRPSGHPCRAPRAPGKSTRSSPMRFRTPCWADRSRKQSQPPPPINWMSFSPDMLGRPFSDHGTRQIHHGDGGKDRRHRPIHTAQRVDSGLSVRLARRTRLAGLHRLADDPGPWRWAFLMSTASAATPLPGSTTTRG